MNGYTTFPSQNIQFPMMGNIIGLGFINNDPKEKRINRSFTQT